MCLVNVRKISLSKAIQYRENSKANIKNFVNWVIPMAGESLLKYVLTRELSYAMTINYVVERYNGVRYYFSTLSQLG